MPLFGRTKKPETVKKVVVAHIVSPAYKLSAAKRGEEVKSLCGEAVIKGEAKPNAPVCQSCFLKQLDVDDTQSAKVLADRYESGRSAGVSEGRRAHASELAITARTQAEAPAFEDLGKALKLKLVDGGEATVRKKNVASVHLEKSGQSHTVTVDGHTVHRSGDEDLARRHYTDVHKAVFG